jgi:hypothetical protein
MPPNFAGKVTFSYWKVWLYLATRRAAVCQGPRPRASTGVARIRPGVRLATIIRFFGSLALPSFGRAKCAFRV